MGIATEVWRSVRYDGRSGCEHHLLLQVARPSAPNADQGAVDAADAFADSAHAHQRAWFEEWRLGSLCGDEHAAEVIGRAEAFFDVDGPGFRWVEVWQSVEDGWLSLSSQPFDAAEPVTAYLLRADGDGDLRDG